MADDSLEDQFSEGDRQLAALAKGLSEDPKTRKAFLKLIKEKHPNQVIPELDTETAMATFAKPYIDKVAALEKKDLEREVQGRIAARRSELKEQGFSSDDVKAIEEMMVKEQIPNHATAANYYKMQKQTAQPTPTALDMAVRMPVDKKAIKEGGGLKNWARTEAFNASRDFKAGRVKH